MADAAASSAAYVQDAVGARAIAIGRLEIDRRLRDSMQRLAEARTLEVLQAVSSYSVTVDILTMAGSGGTLRFRAADAMPERRASFAAAPPVAAPVAAAPSSVARRNPLERRWSMARSKATDSRGSSSPRAASRATPDATC